MPETLLDLSNEEYHKHHAIGSSGLKLIGQSPSHYWARYLDPNREPDQPTPAMKMGTAVHCAVLEPEEFAKRYIVVPEGIDRRSNAGKALFAEIEASGKEPLKHDEMKQVEAMRDAALNHPVSRVLFGNNLQQVETSLFWTDQETSVRCKIRPDFLLPPCKQFPRGLIMDVKTTANASADEFAKQAWNLAMHIQSAWYIDGFMASFDTVEPPPFIWLAQEKESPFATAYYSSSSDLITYGRSEYRKLLTIYAECMTSDSWPGYPQQINTLELPAWAAKVVQDSIPSQ